MLRIAPVSPVIRCILAATALTALPLHAVEIVAHRGASADAPENTVASFKLGWEQQADADELDIYLTKDGQIVVIHDATTKRTAGLDKPVVAQTMEELRTLDAGKWKGPNWAGEKLPTLAEALATVPEGKRMFIEIKCGPEVLPELERVLDASGKKPEQLAIIGFSYPTMRQAKQRFPKLPVYLLSGYAADKTTGEYPKLQDLVDRAKAAGLDGLDLDYHFPLETAQIQSVKDQGLKLFVWTLDDAAIAKKLTAAGIDGITTNRPGWLREQLKP